MASPSTPVSDHVLGGFICCSPHWSLGEATVNKYFEIVSVGTTDTQSHPLTLHHFALFQGRGGQGDLYVTDAYSSTWLRCEDTHGW